MSDFSIPANCTWARWDIAGNSRTVHQYYPCTTKYATVAPDGVVNKKDVVALLLQGKYNEVDDLIKALEANNPPKFTEAAKVRIIKEDFQASTYASIVPISESLLFHMTEFFSR